MHKELIEEIKSVLNNIELSKMLDVLLDEITSIIKHNIELMEVDIMSRSLVVAMILSNGGEFVIKEAPSKFINSNISIQHRFDKNGNFILEAVEAKFN